MRTAVICALAGLGVAATSAHGFVLNTIDFETDDNGNPIVHGQKIDDEFFSCFSITTSGNHEGAAAFDSDLISDSNDPDLLVGLGNVLMFQNSSAPGITGGVFDDPNDATGSGTWTFNFTGPVLLSSLDLIDIDNLASMSIVLTDQGGLTRTYSVPNAWTKDIDAAGPDGYDTLDLTSLLDQSGEGPGGDATASQDLGFDPSDVITLDVTLRGSGAIDNLVFEKIPTPGSLALLGVAGVVGVRRRR